MNAKMVANAEECNPYAIYSEKKKRNKLQRCFPLHGSGDWNEAELTKFWSEMESDLTSCSSSQLLHQSPDLRTPPC